MASRQTGAALGRLMEPDRQRPCAERNGIPDVLRVVCGMRVMARPAGTALYRLVDMQEMEVLVPVPEACKGSGPGFQHKRFLMAVKAEVVVFRIKGRIKNRGEIFPEYPEIVGAVGIVACRAVFLLYRAVMVLVIFKIRFHIHDLAVGSIQLFVVAGHTGVHRGLYQLLGVV